MKIGTKWLHHALIACIGYFAMYILIMIISSFMISGYASQGIDFTCIIENENFVEACPADVVNAYMMASSVSQLVGEFAVIAIVIIIFAKYLKPMFKHFIENKCYIWYLIGIGILYGGNIIYSIILDILQLNSTSSNQDGVNEIIFNAPFVGFLFVVIAAPLFEEIIFRFGVFRAFTHGSKKKAIIGLVLTTLIGTILAMLNNHNGFNLNKFTILDFSGVLTCRSDGTRQLPFPQYRSYRQVWYTYGNRSGS